MNQIDDYLDMPFGTIARIARDNTEEQDAVKEGKDLAKKMVTLINETLNSRAVNMYALSLSMLAVLKESEEEDENNETN